MTKRIPFNIGDKFGRWTIIGDLHVVNTHNHCLCRCDCGTERDVSYSKLRIGESKSCGCINKERMTGRESSSYKEVREGDTFGLLTVVQVKTDHNTKRGSFLHLCRCDCGTYLEVDGQRFRHKRQYKAPLSCGCGRAVSQAKYDHALKEHTAEYNCWYHMIKRCTDPSDESYHHYGGRGVSVYPGWIGDFDAFVRDVGKKPGREYSLDRILVDGNYEPGNVRWANWYEQANNKRTNVIVSHNGVKMSVREWCRFLHKSPSTVGYRVKVMGLTHYEALFYNFPRTRARREKLGWGKKPGDVAVEITVPPPPLTDTCADSALAVV